MNRTRRHALQVGTVLLGAVAAPRIDAAPVTNKAAACAEGSRVLASGRGHVVRPADARNAVLPAIQRFSALSPEQTHCEIVVDDTVGTWHAHHASDRPLFVGSAIKTFILAQNLIDAAAGYDGASLDKRYAVNDVVRSPVSPVLAGLEGEQALRYLLETMIAHSDNTATDIALAAVSPERVRALIADAGLTGTRIPSSTRSLISYLAGAPAGTDWGWQKVSAILSAEALPSAQYRAPLNAFETMASTATDMVKWYRNALRGRYFADDRTLREFKRILRMGDAIDKVVPDDCVAYAKGGSIDWDGFHALSVAGQMRVGRAAASFCFTYNWHDTDAPAARAKQQAEGDAGRTGVDRRTEPERFQVAVKDVLAITAAAMTA